MLELLKSVKETKEKGSLSFQNSYLDNEYEYSLFVCYDEYEYSLLVCYKGQLSFSSYRVDSVGRVLDFGKKFQVRLSAEKSNFS